MQSAQTFLEQQEVPALEHWFLATLQQARCQSAAVEDLGIKEWGPEGIDATAAERIILSRRRKHSSLSGLT